MSRDRTVQRYRRFTATCIILNFFFIMNMRPFFVRTYDDDLRQAPVKSEVNLLFSFILSFKYIPCSPKNLFSLKIASIFFLVRFLLPFEGTRRGRTIMATTAGRSTSETSSNGSSLHVTAPLLMLLLCFLQRISTGAAFSLLFQYDQCSRNKIRTATSAANVGATKSATTIMTQPLRQCRRTTKRSLRRKKIW